MSAHSRNQISRLSNHHMIRATTDNNMHGDFMDDLQLFHEIESKTILYFRGSQLIPFLRSDLASKHLLSGFGEKFAINLNSYLFCEANTMASPHPRRPIEILPIETAFRRSVRAGGPNRLNY
jgi:hypothetical protein